MTNADLAFRQRDVQLACSDAPLREQPMLQATSLLHFWQITPDGFSLLGRRTIALFLCGPIRLRFRPLTTRNRRQGPRKATEKREFHFAKHTCARVATPRPVLPSPAPSSHHFRKGTEA